MSTQIEQSGKFALQSLSVKYLTQSVANNLLIILTVLFTVITSWFMYFLVFGESTIGIDDANIFKVYARNLADGHGFVYNPGGERVEGFSSFLYTLAIAGVYKLTGSFDAPVLFLNLLFLCLITLLTLSITTKAVSPHFNISDKPSNYWRVGFLTVILIILNPYFVLWTSISQMDTGLWTLMILLNVWLLQKTISNPSNILNILGSVIAICMLIFTRPEGMALGLMLIFLHCLPVIRPGIKNSTKIMNCAGLFTVPLLFTLTLTYFRLEYFGWPLPNTYYAKVSPDIIYRLGEGIRYFYIYITNNLFVLPILAAIIHSLTQQFHLIKTDNKKSWLSLDITNISGLLSLLYMAGVIFKGGDHFAGGRFFQPVWPLLVIFVVTKLFNYYLKDKIKSWTTEVWIKFFLLTAAILIIGHLPTQLRTLQRFGNFHYELWIPESGRETGALLNQMFSDNDRQPTIGVITAGGIALTYQGEVYDLLGLNDTSIAHDGGQRKGLTNHASLNPELVLKESPEILMPQVTNFQLLNQVDSPKELLLHNYLFAQQLLQNQLVRDQYCLAWLSPTKINPNLEQSIEGVVVLGENQWLDLIKQHNQVQVIELE